MDISFGDLARRIDPLHPPRLLRGGRRGPGLAGMHRWIGGDPPARLGLRAIGERHFGPRSHRIRLLWLNTELLVAAGARHARARELARIITDRQHPYDLVALCEVLGGVPEIDLPGIEGGTLDAGDIEPVLEVLVEEVRARAPAVEVALGPAGRPGRFSSGLLTFSFGLPLAAPLRRLVFRETGSSRVDRAARKGVLHVPIDLSIGTLDLYSTHMASGVRPTGGHVPDVRETQMAQVDELLDFFIVDRSRHLDRVALVCGDFNIAAHDTDRALEDFDPGAPELAHRDSFFQKMSRFGLTDVWRGRGGPVNYTFYNRHDDAPLDPVCQPATDHNRYCDDDALDAVSGRTPSDEPFSSSFKRLDYIFLEEPTSHHALRVDHARPRRLPFHRPTDAADVGHHPTLSDHLGLEVELVVSPA